MDISNPVHPCILIILIQTNYRKAQYSIQETSDDRSSFQRE